MIRRPPRSTRTDTLLPYTTLFRSAVEGRSAGLSSADLAGEVSLVNVFASWCTACREEHPLFMELKAEGAVPIHGLNYKDKPADAAEWLGTLGDPYTRTRSEERRVGKECVSKCRCRWSRDH